MRFDVVTLFPEALSPYLAASILGRAQQAGLVEIHLHQLRDYSTDPHRKVDDRPFGGGPGMVLSCQPVVDAVEAIEKLDPRPALRVLTTPQGRRLDQQTAREFSGAGRVLLICGHYEGFDERIIEILRPVEISLGDFILTGGELAALAVIDSVSRLLPGVLGCGESAGDESFSGGLLEYPQYTRPQTYRGLSAPAVLLSGHHGEVEKWRRQAAAERTRIRRPDLSPATDTGAARSPRASAGERRGRAAFGSIAPWETGMDAAAARVVAPAVR
ncbi:MAG: tRNA (guanosine(37)-N1)-methyltransferase TrmD [Phycisphaerales bacterium]|nr:tRNA (guanosine(37)-N1)-methyltransferase TrmD [Phycisphaerales bacterium]